jgi:stearoyl-CoA desaturase (Delta-9 desaturase)
MQAVAEQIRNISLVERDVSLVETEAFERTHTAPPPTLRHIIGMVIGVILPFVGIGAAMVVSWRTGWFDQTQLIILIVGYAITGFGITIGYHRLLTHRAFATYAPIRAFFMFSGAMAIQMSPIEWAATHRKHHSLSDKPGDPHTPHGYGSGFFNVCRGLFHAHMGWLFTGHMITIDLERYVPDLMQDRLAVWVKRYWEPLFVPLSYLIPTVVAWAVTGTGKGALMGFLWGGCARVFLLQQMTFAVNSCCHMFGRHTFQANDESGDVLLFGLLGAGDGFHNSHHAFPTSARHGLAWWQLDASWYIIRLLQALGLAWDVKLPTAEMMRSKRIVR